MTGTAPSAAAAALPASGSSFYTAMRILPPEQRDAMYDVYAFCRAVDDIADAEGPREGRRAALTEWRDAINRLYAGHPPDLSAYLAAPVARFGLAARDFHAVIDGMEMDVVETIRAPDWATLDLYCDRVASAVGRLSNPIFGVDPSRSEGLAHHLGRALQLTNILRDIDEDAAIGRLYLPREALLATGIDSRNPVAVAAHPAIVGACAAVAQRARGHFTDAAGIMRGMPRAAAKAPRLMEAAYGSILDRLVARGWAPPRRRVSSNKLRVLAAYLRYGLL